VVLTLADRDFSLLIRMMMMMMMMISLLIRMMMMMFTFIGHGNLNAQCVEGLGDS